MRVIAGRPECSRAARGGFSLGRALISGQPYPRLRRPLSHIGAMLDAAALAQLQAQEHGRTIAARPEAGHQ